jgi:hypothetical protein
LCFLNYLALLRPAADRAVSILPWVVSRGRSYGFLWAGSIIQKKMRKANQTSAYSPVSDRRRLTELIEVHWARRVQAPVPQISGPPLQEIHIIEPLKEEGCAVSTQETAARRVGGASWTLALSSTFSTRPQLAEAVLNGFFPPETPPFSRACHPINLIRSCGSR